MNESTAGTRVLLVTQWYPPEPVEIPRSIVRGLLDQGLDVEVLTGVPNYPDGQVPPGYAAWRPGREHVDGVNVHRTPLFPSHDRSAVRRMANFVSWAVSSTMLGFRALARADVALVYSSPATAALGPLLWHRVLGTPYVLLVQDLWPDSVAASGMLPDTPVTRLAQRALTAFVDATYRAAAHIVIISPGMEPVLTSRGVAADKVSLVYNWSAEAGPPGSEPDQATARRRLGLRESELVLAYAGNLGVMQGLNTLVRAAARAQGRLPLRVLIAGDGVEADALRALARGEDANNVAFLGRLDPAGMQTLRAAADLQYAGLTDDPLFAVTMPSKVQAILASGSPVVVSAPGDVAQVTRESGAGWAVPPGDADGVVSALEEAWAEGRSRLLDRGRSGRAYYEEHMSRTLGTTRLSRILSRAAQRTRKVAR